MDKPSDGTEQAVNRELRDALARRPQDEQGLAALHRDLLRSRLFLTGDPSRPGLGSHAYTDKNGDTVLPIFTDALALERWVATWATEPVPFGTMPGAVIFRGAARMGVGVIAVNLAGPDVLVIRRPLIERLAAGADLVDGD